MAARAPKRTLEERILEADTLCGRNLADANEAREAGDLDKAEKLDKKSQFWKDRYNLLAGNSDREPPKR